MTLWTIPGKPLPFLLHQIEATKPRYDMHGDKLDEGGIEIGVFVRTTPSGKGVTCRRPMSEVVRYRDRNLIIGFSLEVTDKAAFYEVWKTERNQRFMSPCVEFGPSPIRDRNSMNQFLKDMDNIGLTYMVYPVKASVGGSHAHA